MSTPELTASPAAAMPALSAPPHTRPWALVSSQLTARAARIARDLAGVLELHGSTGSGAMEAADFFRSWADGTTEPPELAGAPDAAPLNSPLDALVERFSLTPAEIDLLLLAGLPEEHEGIAATFRSLNPQGEPHPTAGLAALVLNDALVSAASMDARAQLRRLLTSGMAVGHGLLHLAGTGTFFERSLLVADSLWEALHGHDAWPAKLPRVDTPPVPPGLQGWLAGTGPARATAALARDVPGTILVSGSDETIVLSRCVAVATAAGRTLVGARLRAGDTSGIALLAAHAAVRGALPLLVLPGTDQGEHPEHNTLEFADIPGPVLVCSIGATVRAAGNRPVLTLDSGPVGAADQRAAWAAALPGLAEQADGVAARHPLDPALIAELAVDVPAQGGAPGLAEVSALIRTRTGLSLPPGVALLSPAVPWADLVLPAEAAWQLRDAVSRLDYQSVVLEDWGLRRRAHATGGTRMLFTGPPGTGKSLAAHAVATAAATDLLLVDASRLVSKWLGETEKNLAAAFDAAEHTQAVLLLDEADALFGTRTEISDANDRYANLETAYLLQRLDTFDGLLILTTNLRPNIDAAFIRRMDFVVEFPVPDAAARAELWVRHLPAAVDPDLDLAALARLYPVPGGWIRNASIAAAYVAAARKDPISQDHLVAAMKREYAKAALRFPGEPPRRRNDHD